MGETWAHGATLMRAKMEHKWGTTASVRNLPRVGACAPAGDRGVRSGLLEGMELSLDAGAWN